MNTLTKLTLLSLALSATACNEKVSPELQGAAASSTTTGGSTTTVNPSTFYFQVRNTADTMLNYKLHKTGAGNANVDCKISNSTGLTSDLYRGDPSTYDITCFLEAEELSLSFNGLKFAVEASQNTCSYVGYAPFSFFDRMPGSSSQVLHEVTCADENPPTQANIDAVVSASQTGLGCGEMRNATAFPGTSFGSPASDSDLCAFNYTNGPSCDTGIITIISTKVTMTDTDNDGNVDTPVPTSSSRQVSCGGQVANCLDGPFTLEGFDSTWTSGMKVGPTVLNEAYSKEYTYENTFGEYSSNRKYVNYRRDLASLNIEFGNSNRNYWTTDLTSSYLSSFGDPLYKYEFNPELMSMYSQNKRMDGTTLITSTHRTNASQLSGLTVQLPFAAEPFLGVGGFKAQPFYTFYCFDNAYDIRARIRMVVRDWDRVFSSSASDVSFSRISDADQLPPYARQDVPYTDEVTGDPDSWNAFNDVADWDDLIDMEREDGGTSYDPSITIWRTYPVAPYDTATTNGFFNPNWFPAEKP